MRTILGQDMIMKVIESSYQAFLGPQRVEVRVRRQTGMDYIKTSQAKCYLCYHADTMTYN